MTLSPEDFLPNFAAEATSGRTLHSDEFSSGRLVLYFYPKDSTPGCTQEGQDFRDLHPAFVEAGAVVLGVSRDSLKSHENFRLKQNFPFDLISDPEETLCRAFDVIKMKNMYGKQVQGIERSTFLFDRGRLVRAWRKVSVKGHAAEVLQCLQALGPG